uniref:Cyclin-dependent kinase inhibitor domain-containing protein n=1 Tax=Cacopsylla melanoneura TaxID=428564 RepID=A0A8D9ESW1_9HEMI
MLMSRRLPESHPRPSSSIKRRLFQDDEEQSEDPTDDEDPRDRLERHRRLQMNRQSEAENFLNRHVEELDDISRHRWNFDFRNETPINNNGGQWEWNVEVVKLSETNVPKMYLNVLDPNNDDEEPPDENAPANPRNCPTCSKNNLDNNNENLSTPTKSTDTSASQTPIKKRLVQTKSLDNQCSSNKVPIKSSSTSGLSTSSSTVAPLPDIGQDEAADTIVERLDNAIRDKQDTAISQNGEPDINFSNNNDCKSE